MQKSTQYGIHDSLLQEIGSFFGVPSFKLNMDTDIVGYLGADSVDLKELVWMMEDKYQVQLCNTRVLEGDSITVASLLEAIEHCRLNKKGETNMDKLLLGKVAVVTGASTGIGREIALILAREGATLALVGRREEELEKTKQMIEQLGAKADVFIADLQIEASAVGNKIKSCYDSINIIVNAAGVWHNNDVAFYGPSIWELPDEQICEVMNVGILAPMLLTKTLLPSMISANNGGKVINISGTFENGARGWLHYYVSKKAIEDFTIGLSQEVRPYRIQVNAVCPSDTYTEAYKRFYPSEPSDICMDPKDIARLVLELTLDDFDFITGQIIVARNKNAACD